MRNPRCSDCNGRLVRIAFGMTAPGLLQKSGRGLVELGDARSRTMVGLLMLGVSTVFPPRWLTYVGEMDPLYYRRNEKSAP